MRPRSLICHFRGHMRRWRPFKDKGRFRSFLRDNGFRCPKSMTFRSREEALGSSCEIEFPVIVKPTDSAGSKGCTRVDSIESLGEAVDYALRFSIDGGCIVEQFLEKMGDSSDADGFVLDGKMVCVSFTSQLFDPSVPNPYTPAAYMMPASMPSWAQDELRSELQRVCDLLGLRSGVFNIETRVATDGKPYIMEMTPRGGGNRLCEMLCRATGGKTNLIRCAVQAALGEPVDEVSMPEYDGWWYQEMLHSDHDGIFMASIMLLDLKRIMWLRSSFGLNQARLLTRSLPRTMLSAQYFYVLTIVKSWKSSVRMPINICA
ncbi:MAG: ATP-grasp domain-containing protein [Collinsella sp.]